MTTEAQISIAREIMATGLVTKMYHSCQLLKDEQSGRIFPVYQKGAEQPYTGIDDTKGLFGYIRNNGDISAALSRVGSCENAYDITAPLRVVFFHDKERRDFNALTSQLAPFAFMAPVRLLKIITDPLKLLREEQPYFNHSFDGETFYVAFDIAIYFLLSPNRCEQNACAVYPNPICP